MASQSPSGARLTSEYSRAWGAVNRLIREGKSWSGREPKASYLNLGDGTFADVSFASGAGYADDARALALVDWDDDGDLDLWISNRTAPKLRFLANRAADGSSSFALRLRRGASNRDAIGARVDVRCGDRWQVRLQQAGTGYLSQSTKWMHFGLGAATKVDEVVVRWPDGQEQRFSDVPANRRYSLTQGASELAALEPRSTPAARQLVASEPKPLATRSVARIALSSRMPLPEMSATDSRGTRHALGGGKPMLVNFWTSTCPNCRAEFAAWNAGRAELEKLDLRVLALCVDDPEADGSAAALAEWKPWFPCGVASDEWVQTFDVLQASVVDRKDEMRVPTSFLVDGARRLAYVYEGPVSVEDLARDVASLALDDAAFAAASVPIAGRWLAQPQPFGLVDTGGEFFERGALDAARFYVEQGCRGIPAGEGMWQRRASHALVRLALGFSDQQRADDASALLQRAIAYDAKNPAAWFALGELHARAGRNPEAIAALRRATELDPAAGEAWLQLGTLLNSANDLPGGIVAFRGAVAADANDWKAWFALGSSLLASRNALEALPCFRRATEVNAEHARSWTGFGTCLALTGEREAAVVALQKALALDPKDQRASEMLASLRTPK